MSVHPYDRTTHDGKVVDELTHAALLEAERRLGYPLTIVQGSYHPGVSTSAGTHDGGGVVDCAPWDHDRKVLELRRVGFAAWYRPTIPDLWTEHVHAVLIGNARLAPAATAQVTAYLAGRNGLADNGRDTGPRQFVAHRFTWFDGAERIGRAADLIARAQAVLDHGVRGYRIGRTRTALERAARALPDVTPR